MQTAGARLDALNRRLDNFDLALRRHRGRDDTMTAGGKILLERAEQLLQESRAALEHRWQRTSHLPEPFREESRRSICDDFSAALKELGATLLPALDGAMSSRVPVELEPVVQRLAEEAQGNWNCRTLLYAADAFQYSIERHDDPVISIVPNLYGSAAAPGPIEVFIFLRVPEVDRDSATLHSNMIGHELGHLRNWVHKLSTSVPIPEPAQWLDANGVLQLTRVKDYQLYVAVARSWLAEVVSDIIAAFVLGPASLFAFSELVGNLGAWRADSPTHPASDRRVATILDVLDQLGYNAVQSLSTALTHFRAETPGVWGRTASTPHVDGSIMEFVRELVVNNLTPLVSLCQGVLGAHETFDSANWSGVEDAARRLASGVPHGENLQVLAGQFPSPIDDPIILNAAWLVRIQHLTQLGKVVGLDAAISEQASQISAVLDGLVLKSFEIATLRR